MRWLSNIGARQLLANLETSTCSSGQVRAASSRYDEDGATPRTGSGRRVRFAASIALALGLVRPAPALADVPRIGQEIVNTISVTTTEEPLPATSEALVTVA